MSPHFQRLLLDPMTYQSFCNRIKMRKSCGELDQQYFRFRGRKPADIFEFTSTGQDFSGCLCEKSKHQRLRERPRLRTEVSNIFNFYSALLLHFAKDRLFESFSRV